jgi:hypothetical protein
VVSVANCYEGRFYRSSPCESELSILRGQIKGRLLLSEGDKATLAEIAQGLGRLPARAMSRRTPGE